MNDRPETYVHRDGKVCTHWPEGPEGMEWGVPFTTDYPEIWTDEGEEVPAWQPCARKHNDPEQLS